MIKSKRKIDSINPAQLEKLTADLYPPEPREHNVARLRRVHRAALNFAKAVFVEVNGRARCEALDSIRYATRAAMVGIQTEKLNTKFCANPSPEMPRPVASELRADY